MEQQEPSFILVGMQNGADSVAVSHKAKGSFSIWSNHHTPWYLPKRVRDYGIAIKLDIIQQQREMSYQVTKDMEETVISGVIVGYFRYLTNWL